MRPWRGGILVNMLLVLALSPSARTYGQELGYHIDATLDEDERLLDAHQLVTLTNWSRAPLDRLYFHLFPNELRALEKAQLSQRSHRLDAFQNPLRAFPRGDDGGYLRILSVSAQGRALRYLAQGSWLTVFLPQALAPGQRIEVEMHFQTRVPQVESYLSYQGEIYTIALWYPLLAFLTEVGWLYRAPVGVDEFCANFADYRVSLRLPAGMVVAATGCLERADQQGGGPPVQTWVARGVRSFGWVGSARFLVSRSYAPGLVVSSLYLPGHHRSGAMAGLYARRALLFYGARLGPYPHGQYAVVECPLTLAGFALPGLGLISTSLYGLGDMSDLLEATVAHEVAHQWWGERVDVPEPWFCEGFARFWEFSYLRAYHGCEGWLFKGGCLPGPIGQLSLRWLSRSLYLNLARLEMEDPANLPAGQFRESLSSQVALYAKAPLVLQRLHRLMGDAAFLCFCRSLLRWPRRQLLSWDQVEKLAQGAHGGDLSGFFQQWLGTTGRCDDAIEGISCQRVGRRFQTRVRLRRKGQVIMPTAVILHLRDGSRLRRLWDGPARHDEVSFLSDCPPQRATLDPQDQVLDLYPADNIYPRKRKLSICLWNFANITPDTQQCCVVPQVRLSSRREPQVGVSISTAGLMFLSAPSLFQWEQSLAAEIRWQPGRRGPLWRTGYVRRVPLFGARTTLGASCWGEQGRWNMEGTVRWIGGRYLFRTPYRILRCRGRYRKIEDDGNRLFFRLDFILDRRRTVFFPTFGDILFISAQTGFDPDGCSRPCHRLSAELWHHWLVLGDTRSCLRLFGGILTGLADREEQFDLARDAHLYAIGDGPKGRGCLAIGQELSRSVREMLDWVLFGRLGLLWPRDEDVQMMCQMGMGLLLLGNSPLSAQIDLPVVTRDLRSGETVWRLGCHLNLGSRPEGL